MIPFKIDGRPIGGGPTFIIAEIGVNHDGSAQKAIELARIAANCGASAVKLQIFRAASLMHSSAVMAEYQKDRTHESNPADMLRKYELSNDDLRKVVKAIRDLGMVPLATPFSPTDVEVIESLRLPAIKIASPDLINRPLLARAARANRPLLLSTGASEISEIETAVRWLKEWKLQFALLHCISAYPTPAAQANLAWISELSAIFDVPIGYSDHTTDIITGGMAVAAGACVVERHLTYDRAAHGPDHSASSDPIQFERYVKLIREAQPLRGTPGKRVLEIEQDVRTASRQSLVARRTIRAGEAVIEDDLTVQRPGTGISAADFQQVVGQKVLKVIPAGSILQWDMLACGNKASTQPPLSDVA